MRSIVWSISLFLQHYFPNYGMKTGKTRIFPFPIRKPILQVQFEPSQTSEMRLLLVLAPTLIDWVMNTSLFSSSQQTCSMGKGVLRNFAKIHRKTSVPNTEHLWTTASVCYSDQKNFGFLECLMKWIIRIICIKSNEHLPHKLHVALHNLSIVWKALSFGLHLPRVLKLRYRFDGISSLHSTMR